MDYLKHAVVCCCCKGLYSDTGAFRVNFNVNINICFREFVKVVEAKRIVYNNVTLEQIQQKGAFLIKVVPLFRLNKLLYCVPCVCSFISFF